MLVNKCLYKGLMQFKHLFEIFRGEMHGNNVHSASAYFVHQIWCNINYLLLFACTVQIIFWGLLQLHTWAYVIWALYICIKRMWELGYYWGSTRWREPPTTAKSIFSRRSGVLLPKAPFKAVRPGSRTHIQAIHSLAFGGRGYFASASSRRQGRLFDSTLGYPGEGPGQV